MLDLTVGRGGRGEARVPALGQCGEVAGRTGGEASAGAPSAAVAASANSDVGTDLGCAVPTVVAVSSVVRSGRGREEDGGTQWMCMGWATPPGSS